MAFTGHRTCGEEAVAPLDEALLRLYQAGFTRFLSGMALGFDLLAAEAVLRLRARFSEVQFGCVVPFARQAERFPEADRLRFERLLREADEVVLLEAEFSPGCYHRRNDFLVEQAARLVAWFDGSKGGTEYTLKRARRRGLHCENLFPNPQGELFTEHLNKQKL